MVGMMRMLVLVLLCSVHTVAADDALVLPQGRWHLSAEARFSLPITRRFTPEGGTEDLATDFNRELNSLVFPDLRLVEAAFGLHEGSATFGRSVVTFEQHIQIGGAVHVMLFLENLIQALWIFNGLGSRHCQRALLVYHYLFCSCTPELYDRIDMHFLLTFPEVTPIGKTRTQLIGWYEMPDLTVALVGFQGRGCAEGVQPGF